MEKNLLDFKILTVTLLLMAVSTMAVNERFVIDGEQAGDQFGDAVAVMDFNGDGFDDFIIGAPVSDAGGTSSGKIYIYYGGPGIDAVADMEIIGSAGSFFGAAIANAGDINGDSYDDLIVGAPYYSVIASRAGAAYLFYGGPSADTAVDLTFYGASSLDYFGTALAGGFDFNGDGLDDLAIGVYKADFGLLEDAGLVNIHYGSITPDTVTDIILTANIDGERFGLAMAPGNYNGDGYDDLAVGAYSYDDWTINLGRAYIFHGGLPPDSIFDYAVGGKTQGEFFGFSLATTNPNGDSFDDLLVGAYGYKVGQAEVGRVYLFEGSSVMDTVPEMDYIPGSLDAGRLGFNVASGADIDGDGREDFWAGAPGNDRGTIFDGSNYTADTTLNGQSGGEDFGHITAISPNLFGIQKPGIVVGAMAYGSYRGRAYIYSQDNSSGNQPPVLDPIGDKTIAAGQKLEFGVTAYDPDGTTPDLDHSTLPSGASFTDYNTGAGIFSWTPTTGQQGNYQVTFYASDGQLQDSEVVAIEVIADAVSCGDANADQLINVGDPVFVINYIFKDGTAPSPLCRADVNGDGDVNVGDAVYLINFVFNDGDPPLEPCCP